MRITRKKTKALLHFHTKHGYTKARRSDVIRILPILLLFKYSFGLHVLLPSSDRMIVMLGKYHGELNDSLLILEVISED